MNSAAVHPASEEQSTVQPALRISGVSKRFGDGTTTVDAVRHDSYHGTVRVG